MIYAIVCEPTGERYIGATANFRQRRGTHLNELRAKRHACKRLQAAFDAHGESALLWSVLDEVPGSGDSLKAALAAAEQRRVSEVETSHPGMLLNKPGILYRGKDPNHVPGLAAKLREAREAAGLSQVAAGEKSGVHHISIAKFETKKSTPTVRVLYLLAKAYGVKVADLLPPELTAEDEQPAPKKPRKS